FARATPRAPNIQVHNLSLELLYECLDLLESPIIIRNDDIVIDGGHSFHQRCTYACQSVKVGTVPIMQFKCFEQAITSGNFPIVVFSFNLLGQITFSCICVECPFYSHPVEECFAMFMS